MTQTSRDCVGCQSRAAGSAAQCDERPAAGMEDDQWADTTMPTARASRRLCGRTPPARPDMTITDRRCGCATELADGRIIAIVGHGDMFGAEKTSEILDPATMVWTAGPAPPSHREESTVFCSG